MKEEETENASKCRETRRQKRISEKTDKKKEEDEEREGKDSRKGERWGDGPLLKDPGESRRLPSSEHRETNFEARRDGKWSNKWGPEDKSYEARREKWVGPDKEDGHRGKYASPLNAKMESVQEVDIQRERENIWRPHSLISRGRGESSAVGIANSPKSAPGFGGRNRNDGNNTGFTPGRGRGTTSNSLIRNGQLNSAQVPEKQNSSGHVLRYTRDTILDIYRQTSTIAGFTERFIEGQELTVSVAEKPLALSGADKDEEVGSVP